MITSKLREAVYIKNKTGEDFIIVDDFYKTDKVKYSFKNSDEVFNVRNFIESLALSNRDMYELELRDNITLEEIREVQCRVMEYRDKKEGSTYGY